MAGIADIITPGINPLSTETIRSKYKLGGSKEANAHAEQWLPMLLELIEPKATRMNRQLSERMELYDKVAKQMYNQSPEVQKKAFEAVMSYDPGTLRSVIRREKPELLMQPGEREVETSYEYDHPTPPPKGSQGIDLAAPPLPPDLLRTKHKEPLYFNAPTMTGPEQISIQKLDASLIQHQETLAELQRYHTMQHDDREATMKEQAHRDDLSGARDTRREEDAIRRDDTTNRRLDLEGKRVDAYTKSLQARDAYQRTKEAAAERKETLAGRKASRKADQQLLNKGYEDYKAMLQAEHTAMVAEDNLKKKGDKVPLTPPLRIPTFDQWLGEDEGRGFASRMGIEVPQGVRGLGPAPMRPARYINPLGLKPGFSTVVPREAKDAPGTVRVQENKPMSEAEARDKLTKMKYLGTAQDKIIQEYIADGLVE